MGDRLVGVEDVDGVRTVTLDSPSNRNALSFRLLDELAAALGEAAADGTVRVVVLTGAGTVFCSGADLSERGSAAPNRMPEVLRTLAECPKPVIARVNGAARAGGLGLIAAADIAVAAEAATFAFTEVRVGVAPAMILVPLLRVFEPRFLALAVLTGEPYTAAEAAAAGLLSAVVPDEAALDEWVLRAGTRHQQGLPGRGAGHQGAAAFAADPGLRRGAWSTRRGDRPSSSPARRRLKGWPPSWRSAGRPGTQSRERDTAVSETEP